MTPQAPEPKPWRTVLRLGLMPVLIGVARIAAAWNRDDGTIVGLALLPCLLLALGACISFVVALAALCLRLERYAAIEVGLGMSMSVAAVIALMAGLSGSAPIDDGSR
jgi:hypothetical protein